MGCCMGMGKHGNQMWQIYTQWEKQHSYLYTHTYLYLHAQPEHPQNDLLFALPFHSPTPFLQPTPPTHLSKFYN